MVLYNNSSVYLPLCAPTVPSGQHACFIYHYLPDTNNLHNSISILLLIFSMYFTSVNFLNLFLCVSFYVVFVLSLFFMFLIFCPCFFSKCPHMWSVAKWNSTKCTMYYLNSLICTYFGYFLIFLMCGQGCYQMLTKASWC